MMDETSVAVRLKVGCESGPAICDVRRGESLPYRWLALGSGKRSRYLGTN